jgi:hypothetical protein
MPPFSSLISYVLKLEIAPVEGVSCYVSEKANADGVEWPRISSDLGTSRRKDADDEQVWTKEEEEKYHWEWVGPNQSGLSFP